MSILAGIGYFLVASALCRVLAGVIPAIALIGAGAYFFGLSYALLIASVVCVLMFGVPNQAEMVDASNIRRRFGAEFSLLGMVLLIASVVTFIVSLF